MMDREWAAILRRYGCPVTLLDGEEGRTVRAFMQQVREQDSQLAPSVLGLRREERAVYLGPAGETLTPGSTAVIWNGQEFEVRACRQVGDGHHVWAILQRLEDET